MSRNSQYRFRSRIATIMMLIIACLTGGLVYLNAASDLNKIAARTITPRGPLTDEENSTIAIFEHAKKISSFYQYQATR
jgi:hypothetical protein